MQIQLCDYQRNWVQSSLHSLHVVDLPPLVLSRLGTGCPRVYMEQCVSAFHAIIQARRNTSILSTRQFLSQLPFIAYNINHRLPTNQHEVVQTALTSLQFPSSLLHSTFQTIWRAIAPDPAISLTHTVFSDDYYLRIQERSNVCEMMMALCIASYMRIRHYQSVSEDEVGYCSHCSRCSYHHHYDEFHILFTILSSNGLVEKMH